MTHKCCFSVVPSNQPGWNHPTLFPRRRLAETAQTDFQQRGFAGPRRRPFACRTACRPKRSRRHYSHTLYTDTLCKEGGGRHSPSGPAFWPRRRRWMRLLMLMLPLVSFGGDGVTDGNKYVARRPGFAKKEGQRVRYCEGIVWMESSTGVWEEVETAH